jgi:hypothetical protein
MSINKTESVITGIDNKDFYPMSYDDLSSVPQNVLKFYHQLTGEEKRIPFIFDDFHYCHSRVIGLDMTENRIVTLIKSNNSGTAKVKIIKYKRDPSLFTSKLLIKFQNILRNTTQVIIRHRVTILFSVNFITSLPVKSGGSFSFLTIFTFAVPVLLDLI